MLFAQFQGALYIGNATEAIQKTVDGVARADIGGSPAMPVCYPAGPYRSRLLGFGDPTNPKRIYYTDTYSENIPANNYITVEHPEIVRALTVFGRDEDAGVFGDLGIFMDTATFLIRGDFASGSQLIERSSDQIGSLSPLSIVDTPYGPIGLGYDGSDELVVFMIPIGMGRPILISDEIRTVETLPRAYRHLANAVYHNGFYRLSFVPSGSTVPNKEWWADLRYFSTSLPNFGIGWWGPMTGRNVGAMAIQDGAGDANELIAADSNAGYVNTLDGSGVYKDYGTAYTAIFETKYLDGGDPMYMKTLAGFSLGAKATANENVHVEFQVDEGASVATEVVPVAVDAPLVGDSTLVGEDTIVGGERFAQYVQFLSSPLFGQRAAGKVTYTGGNRFAIKRFAPIGTKSRRLFA
jgi:hypothetical protein